MSTTRDATTLLKRLEGGEEAAAQDLFPLVYDELRRAAGVVMQRERESHTLQPTALVHEAFFKLIDEKQRGWSSRRHFVHIAARAMRQILIDHARAKGAAKRGGDGEAVPLDQLTQGCLGDQLDALALHEALETLSARDPQLAEVVELRFFGGLTVVEIAELQGLTDRQVERRWLLARSWLARELGRDL